MNDLIERLNYIKNWKCDGDSEIYKTLNDAISALENLTLAQSELEDKIRAIGYTGKEGRIYIGGRLFAVRELPQ